MAEHNSVWHWLESAGLERYYNKFRTNGITEENFTELSLADYDDVGVTAREDRQRLFKLVQVVKRELEAQPKISAPKSRLPTKSPARRTGLLPPGSIADAPKRGGRSVSGEERVRPKHLKRVRSDGDDSSGGRGGRGGRPKTPSVDASAGGGRRRDESRSKRSASPQPLHRANSSRRSRREQYEDEPGRGGGSGRPGAELSPPGSRRSNSPVSVSVADSVASSSAPDGVISLDGMDPTADDPFRGSKIRVVVRKRPVSKKEGKRGEKDVITFSRSNSQALFVHEHRVKVDLTKYVEKHQFVFDEVFNSKATNADIYQRTVRPLVSFFLNKGKATCFAYGQTGAGKTFTMMGPGGSSPHKGLYHLACADIFRALEASRSRLCVMVSFFEIYGGKLFDLLDNRKKLTAREDANKVVNVVGLREEQCHSLDELLQWMATGNGSRSTGSTGANMDSSRSHAILQILLKTPAGRKKSQKAKVHGKLSFIDLAGSERGADTMSNNKQTRIEGAEINRSLLALKECIRALDQKAHHQPFRGSKLTQVLKDSFIGNSRTIMIANVSPTMISTEHTLNTLRYADRVKELRGSKKKGGVDAYMPHKDNKGNVERIRAEDYDSQSDEEDSPDDLEHKGLDGADESEFLAPLPSRDDQRRREQKRKRPAPKPKQRKPPPPPPELDEKEQTEDLLRTHQQICAAILEEEDEIVEAHRRQIDDTMKLVKEEMQLLKKFDQLSFSAGEYAEQLDSILAQKIGSISALREKISIFRNHIREEELLSKSLKGGALNLLPDHLDIDVNPDDFDGPSITEVSADEYEDD